MKPSRNRRTLFYEIWESAAAYVRDTGSSRACVSYCFFFCLSGLLACSPLRSAAADSSAAGSNQPSLAELADAPLEQLAEIPIETVSGASRYEQKVTQAPASVSIVTADEIKKFGYRTLGDILESMPGVFVTSDRNYSYLGVRGFGRPGDYNSRVLLLVDGHRMNDNIFDQALLGTEGIIDVDLIERVEFIRGPSSSIYGDNAFFGVVNVITRAGHQINGAEASVSAGAFDTYKGRFSFGRRFTNDVEMVLSGSWYESEGADQLFYPEFNTPANNFGIARDSDHDSAQNLFGSVSWRDLTLTSAFVNREKVVPTASFNTVFNSRQEQTTDLRTYVDLKYQHDFSEETRLMARLYYDLYSYDGHYPYYASDFGLPLPPTTILINHDDAVGEWAGTEWQVTQKLFERHVLIAGVEYRENIRQFQHSYYDLPELDNVRIENSGRNVGIYSQAEINVLTNLTFNGGLRYDHYDTFGGTVNPRLGLLYSPWEPTTFKLLYGQAFRAPNVFELYYEDPGANRANPNLQPETIRTYELVWEQYLPANLRFSASGYYYEIHDLISQQIDPFNQTYFANVDEVHAKGLELQLEHKSTSGLLARVSYAVQRAEDMVTDEELSNSPRHLAKLNLIVPLYRDKLFTGLEVLYTSPVRTLAARQADGFTVVNLTLFSQRIVKGLEVSGSIYNLFDSRYGFPASADLRQDVVEQDGRSFRIKLTYHF